MPLGYVEIMETDLSVLKDAASSWRAMSKKFETLHTRYDEHARDVVGVNRWIGQAAMAAVTNSAFTSHEYEAASVQAAAVAQHLDTGYTELHRLKEELKGLVTDAREKHFHVDARTGRVTYDTDQLTAKERDDDTTMNTIHQRETEWNEATARAVKRIDYEDGDIKRRLLTEVKDRDGKGDSHGFNGVADGNAARVDARRTDALADKIRAGGDVDPAVVEEADRLMRENAGDKTYSRTLLNSLGPDGVIDLSKSVQERGYDVDGSVNKDYRSLEGGLSRVLASGTKVPGSVAKHPPGSAAYKDWLKTKDGQWYGKFTDGLAKAGRENFGPEANPLKGYQVLVGTMENGGAKFDDQFLYDLGDDIIAAEKSEKGIWTAWNGGHPGATNDPLDGVLNVMSRTPDAATGFLNPDGNGTGDNHVGNDHLRYLLSDGDHGREWPELAGSYGGDVVTRDDDPTSRQGLAAALEAGTTGHTPLVGDERPTPQATHTEAQAKIMNATLHHLDDGPQTEIPANLRQPLANALAEYTPDTHETLSGNAGRDYIKTGIEGGVFGADKNGDGAHLAANGGSLTHVLRGLSDSPEAYAVLHKAESDHIGDILADIPKDATDSQVETPLDKAGSTLGTYGAIREDVLNDQRSEGYSDADWKAKVAYHVVGGLVTPLPGGDVAQRVVDTWAWEMGNDLKADQDAKTNAEISDHYFKANNQIKLMVDEWAEQRGIDTSATKGENISGAWAADMLNGYDRGNTLAGKYLTNSG